MLREYRKMIWSDWNPFRNVSPRIMIMAFAVCLLIPNIMYHKKLILKKYERWWLSGTLFWIFIILSATLIGRQVQAEPRKNLEFFWCLRLALQTGKFRYWGDIIGNILLFIPLGLLIPLAFPQLSKLYIVFFCGMILSVSIELIQYFARLGILELDDIFHNTCGTVSGYLMYRGIRADQIR